MSPTGSYDMFMTQTTSEGPPYLELIDLINTLSSAKSESRCRAVRRSLSLLASPFLLKLLFIHRIYSLSFVFPSLSLSSSRFCSRKQRSILS